MEEHLFSLHYKGKIEEAKEYLKKCGDEDVMSMKDACEDLAEILKAEWDNRMGR